MAEKRDDFTPTSDQIPLDNSTVDCLNTAETVQEGFEELCTYVNDFKAIANPGFTWGSSGAIKNSYLQNDTVPSNLSGRLSTVTGNITAIFIVTENDDDAYTLEIRRKDNGTFTTLTTISAVSTDGLRKYTLVGLTVPVSTGDELSAYIQKSGNKGATNPVCGIILEGIQA